MCQPLPDPLPQPRNHSGGLVWPGHGQHPFQFTPERLGRRHGPLGIDDNAFDRADLHAPRMLVERPAVAAR